MSITNNIISGVFDPLTVPFYRVNVEVPAKKEVKKIKKTIKSGISSTFKWVIFGILLYTAYKIYLQKHL